MVGGVEMPRTIAGAATLSATPRLAPSFSASNSTSTSTSANTDDFLPSRSRSSTNSHLLSLPKPSLLVRTQSNVRKERRRKPEPPCVVCDGTGRVDCHHCHGRGRTNCTDLIMLPKGEWPKWTSLKSDQFEERTSCPAQVQCKTCGGSGLGYCSRCLGTGEYRDIMGFHFMKREANHFQKQKTCQNKGNAEPLTSADLLLSQTPSEDE